TSLAEVSDEVLALAQRAVYLDPGDVIAYNSMGWALLFRADHEGALAEARKALAISPNFVGAHYILGITLLFSGQPRAGLEAIRNCMSLDPLAPTVPERLGYIAMAHYLMGEYDASVEAAKAALRSNPDHQQAYRWLTAALGQAGRLGEAK